MWVLLTHVLFLKILKNMYYLIDKTKIDFDGIGISESRVKKK